MKWTVFRRTKDVITGCKGFHRSVGEVCIFNKLMQFSFGPLLPFRYIKLQVLVQQIKADFLRTSNIINCLLFVNI